MPPQGPPSRSQRRQAIAADIEIAALELSLAHGIANLSADAVAKAAGISRRTFYRYFPSVEDVLLASSRRSLARIANDVRARPPGETVREAIVNAFAAKRVEPGELVIQALNRRVAAAEPKAWIGLASRIEGASLDTFAGVIAERLPAGRDTGIAIVVAKVLLTIITHYFPLGDARDADAGGIDQIDRTLDDILAALAGRWQPQA